MYVPGEPDYRRDLRRTVATFGAREIAPNMRTWEEEGLVPRSLHKAAAAAGILGIGYAEEIGGSGGDLLDLLAATEEIVEAGGTSGLCAALLGHNLTTPHILEGSEEQIEKWAKPILLGEAIAAFAVTEPGGGTDVAAMRTRANRTSAGYTLTGSKTFITSATRADFFMVGARVAEREIGLFMVPSNSPGVSVSAPFKKMGWLCSDTAEITFDAVEVPAVERLDDGDGFKRLMRHFETERLFLSAQAYATAARVMTLAIAWAKERVVLGSPLAEKQVIAHMIAEMHTKAEIARAYTYEAARAHLDGHGGDGRVRSAIAKNAAVAAASFATDRAVQIFGGNGYMREFEVEMHFRDARLLPIGGGADEVLNEVIAKSLLK